MIQRTIIIVCALCFLIVMVHSEVRYRNRRKLKGVPKVSTLLAEKCHCGNGGTCDQEGMCTCLPWTFGPSCENVDCTLFDPECRNSGGACLYDKNKKQPYCKCPEGKSFDKMSKECKVSCPDCENGGICNPERTCTCLPWTSGLKCEMVNCTSVEPWCRNSGGKCLYDENTKTPFCKCPEGKFVDKSSMACKENCFIYNCKNGGTCNGKTGCSCLPLTRGPYCEIIDCSSINPGCKDSGGKCYYNEKLEKPDCLCPTRKFFNEVTGKCDGTCSFCKCKNGGKCDGKGGCTCLPLTNGSYCEIIDCSSIDPDCKDTGGNCYYNETLEIPECLCPAGKHFNEVARKCDDTCPFINCENGGTCNINGRCSCPPLTSGAHCEIIDCSFMDQDCIDSGGKCDYNGQLETLVCLCPASKIFHEVTQKCEDRCSLHKCKNGGTCNDKERCSCPPLTSGPFCDIFDCSETYPGCKDSGGNCYYSETWKRPLCSCPTLKFFNDGSKKCEEKCVDDPCRNGGTCLSYSMCICPPATFGAKCENVDCSQLNPRCANSGGLCEYSKKNMRPVCRCPENKIFNKDLGTCED